MKFNILSIIVILIITFFITYLLYSKYFNNKIYKKYKKYKIKHKFPETNNKYLRNLDEKYEYLYNYMDLVYFEERLKQMADIYKKQQNSKLIKEENILVPLVPQQPHNTRDVYIPEIPIDYYELDENDLFNFEQNNQTIHDSFVQKKVSNDYSNLKTETNCSKQDDEKIELDIIEFIKMNNLRNTNGTEKIRSIIDKIKTRNCYISNLNDSEYEILKTTWKLGDNNVKTELINQLEDCLDEKYQNSLFCPTGVATRIIESTYINNPEKYPKTKEVLNQEMLNTAAKLRTNNPDLSINEFKLKLIDIYSKEYEGILNKKQINEQIQDWIDYV